MIKTAANSEGLSDLVLREPLTDAASRAFTTDVLRSEFAAGRQSFVNYFRPPNIAGNLNTGTIQPTSDRNN